MYRGRPGNHTTQQTTPGSTASNYTGPAAANADVQSFKVNLWENIRTSDKCGGCHHEGGQSPMFARSDDVNLAYQAANPLVNFQQPDQSTLVLQVGSGHNCWVADAKACADTMLTWIKAWVGSSATSNTGVTVTAPTSTDVAGGKQFPTTAELGGDGAHGDELQGNGVSAVDPVLLRLSSPRLRLRRRRLSLHRRMSMRPISRRRTRSI